MRLHIIILMALLLMVPATAARAQDALKAYRAGLAKAALAQDPTAARQAAINEYQQKLFFENSEKNLPAVEAAINEMLRLDFVAGADALLSSFYSIEIAKAMVARMPADIQAGVKDYFGWVSASYTAEHSSPPGAVPYPAHLPPRGYGFGKTPPAGAVATARPAATTAITFTPDDLANRRYGYYNRFHDNTSKIIIDLAHPEKSCFTYQSGTKWGYFKVLQPAQLWEGDQVWWHDSLQVVAIYDTANIRIGKETYALKAMRGPVMAVREFRLSPDYHDVKCTRCNGRGAIDPKNDGGSVSYQRGTVRSEHIDRHPDGTATRTTEYNMVMTGSTIKPAFTCPACNGRGYVHQADYNVEYRR